MSSPRFDWWGYVKGMIRRYPRLKEKYADLRNVSLTARYGEHVRTKSVVSSTELAAIRELPATSQREYEAVRQAVETTKRIKNGETRIKLIDLVFWKNTHTLSGAALKLYVSYDTAQNWHSEFIRLVAKNYGLMDTE